MSRPLVVGRKADGRAVYDPEAKRELLELCEGPGVSVAALALRHGMNANVLHSWIAASRRKARLGREVGALSQEAMRTRFATIEMAPASALAGDGRVSVELPNGVRLEIRAGDRTAFRAVVQVLAALPCSASMPG